MAPDAPEPEPRPAPLPATTPARRILVVEDNEDAAVTMKLVLQRWGHRVEVATDGKQALEMADAFAPEIVLCDIGLPGGMDGYDVARALRAEARFRGVFLVALTGYGGDEDKALATRAGFDAHVTKPASREALKGILAKVGQAD